ncbi:phage integrase SAM-like domain-containing protein [Intestinibacter sp.]
MELTWINEEHIYGYFTQNKAFKWDFKRVMEQFYQRYPTPQDWLKSEKKETIKIGCTSELVYILFWTIETNIWSIKEYRETMFNYFLSKGNNSYIKTVCIKKGIMTEKYFEKIKSLKSPVKQSRIAILCTCYRKHFKDITDEEINEFQEFNNDKSFTRTGVANLRIKLGLSNKKVLRNSTSRNWAYLCSHNKFGKIFSEYLKIIKASSTKNYVTTSGTSLKYLLEFVELNNIEDFSCFNSSIFEDFIEYLEIEKNLAPQSITSYIPKIKNFFETNLKEEFFSEELDFCDLFWSSYSRMSKKLSRESEGLSFSDNTLPEKIVRELLLFEPTNEIEFVCQRYWMLISSCPARMRFIMYLEAHNALKPLPNNPDSFGIYSSLADKAGNIYGQFPILDKIGVNAIKDLQKRASELNLQPVLNPYNGKTYVHLFQLTSEPWILNSSMAYNFFNEHLLSKIKLHYDNITEIRATAHSFRHYLITHIAMLTGDIKVCQTAAGHHNEIITEEYLRSRASRQSLLLNVVDKYENHEITGKFYLKLVHLLTSSDTVVDEMLYSLTTEMKLDEFFKMYGKRVESGYCFSKEDCSNWYACWGCSNFIITKSEISQAIKILSNQILELKNLQQCTDFSFETPSIDRKMNLICTIIKRLTELGLSEEDISTMVNNCLENKDLMLGVDLNA